MFDVLPTLIVRIQDNKFSDLCNDFWWEFGLTGDAINFSFLAYQEYQYY